jgi:paraquat-inducible protein A
MNQTAHASAVRMDHRPEGLLACAECDLLQRIPATSAPAASVRCVRCGALFWHESRGDHRRALALACTGLMLLLMANAFPLTSVVIGAVQTETTLGGTARALAEQGMPALAALVFFTLVVAPTLQLAALCWLLLPTPDGRRRPGFALASRVLPATRPWSMVEVFMLGALVSLGKISDLATVIPGVALAALVALMLVMSAACAAFDTRELWESVPGGAP